MSDIEKYFHRNSFIYLLISLFLALTGFVYEHYSHGIYSYSMMYAFAVPLTLGTLTNEILVRFKAHLPGNITKQLWHTGVATLTLGLFVSGVFEIFGTANQLLNLYYVVGPLLLALSSGCYYFKYR